MLILISQLASIYRGLHVVRSIYRDLRVVLSPVFSHAGHAVKPSYSHKVT